MAVIFPRPNVLTPQTFCWTYFLQSFSSYQWFRFDQKTSFNTADDISRNLRYFNSSPSGKMDAITQTIFSDAFFQWKYLISFEISPELFSQGSNWQYTTIGSDNGLAPKRQQAIFWTNADPIHWRIYDAGAGVCELGGWGWRGGLVYWKYWKTWWRHQMEAFSALLAICAGNSPVTGEFPAQRPVTRSFDFFFDLNKRWNKQWWGWWFKTPLHPLWCHCNDISRARVHQSETFDILHTCRLDSTVAYVPTLNIIMDTSLIYFMT